MTTLSLTKTVSAWPADVSQDALDASSTAIRRALMAFDTPLYFAQTAQGLACYPATGTRCGRGGTSFFTGIAD